MKHNVTRMQYKKLEGLASAIYASYDCERLGHILVECDRALIPFFVQNAVIEFARDWRRYKSEHLTSILEIDGGREK